MAYNLSITQKEAITLLELLQQQKALTIDQKEIVEKLLRYLGRKTASESVEHESSPLSKNSHDPQFVRTAEDAGAVEPTPGGPFRGCMKGLNFINLGRNIGQVWSCIVAKNLNLGTSSPVLPDNN